MSLRKAACLAAVVAFSMLASQAQAQREIHHVPPWINGNGNNPDVYHPFVDLTAFPHDMQFFAPAEFGEFGGGPDLNTGWFGAADRLYIYVSRSDEEQTGPTQGDFTWGNRFTVGYMSEEDHGWFGEYWHIDGPNASNIVEAERVNVLQPLDEINGDPDNVDLRGGGGGGGGGGGQQQQNPQRTGVPTSDRNNPVSQDRRYFLHDSVNSADLTSWEFNKSFRLKKLHHNSVIEPFFGFRYMKFQDTDRFDLYNRIDDMGAVVSSIPGAFPPFGTDVDTLENELFTRTQMFSDNHLVGGQFGMRWFKYKGR